MTKRILNVITITALALSLSACLSIEQQTDKAVAKARSQGRDVPEWKVQAVKQGCRSGYAVAGDIYSSFSKDYDLYRDNVDYKNVYDDAFEMCKARHLQATRY